MGVSRFLRYTAKAEPQSPNPAAAACLKFYEEGRGVRGGGGGGGGMMFWGLARASLPRGTYNGTSSGVMLPSDIARQRRSSGRSVIWGELEAATAAAADKNR